MEKGGKRDLEERRENPTHKNLAVLGEILIVLEIHPAKGNIAVVT